MEGHLFQSRLLDDQNPRKPFGYRAGTTGDTLILSTQLLGADCCGMTHDCFVEKYGQNAKHCCNFRPFIPQLTMSISAKRRRWARIYQRQFCPHPVNSGRVRRMAGLAHRAAITVALVTLPYPTQDQLLSSEKIPWQNLCSSGKFLARIDKPVVCALRSISNNGSEPPDSICTILASTVVTDGPSRTLQDLLHAAMLRSSKRSFNI